jgi:carbamate kinase
MATRRDLTVVALGGNALLPAGSDGTIAAQRAVARRTMSQLADAVSGGARCVVTHGNGPIVGNILLRNEALASSIAPMPLDVCGADSQGGIGYVLQQALQNELARHGVRRAVATLVTQVEVDASDPAFEDPSKPIGPYYEPAEAERLAAARGWVVRDDAGRGFRRVVASPRPLRIVEADVVRLLVEEGVLVICAGGGGVPVVRRNGAYEGVEAVVDKDRTAAVLAIQLRATRLVLLTGVEHLVRGYGTPGAKPLHTLSAEDAERLLEAGEFPPGSMGPKIEAAVSFLRTGGREVVVTDPDHAGAALRGAAGTRIAA